MSTPLPIRIPVCNADGVITEHVDAARARRLALASNATVVHLPKRKGGGVVRILLASTADCSLENEGRGNPRSYSNKNERDKADWTGNPTNVWTLKPIPSSTADIFRAIILDMAA